MKKVIRLFRILILLVTSISLGNNVCAQCENLGPVYVGTSIPFESSPQGTQTHWTLSGGATTTDNRGAKSINVTFVTIGISTVQVTYRTVDDVIQMCWMVPVVNPISGGSITSTVSSYTKGEVFLYSNLKNATTASGGINEYYNKPYIYQWEESSDGNIWTPISGASDVNCTGSNYHERKMYYRRKASSDREIAYSNIVSVDIVAPLNAGLVGNAQVVQAGETPSKLISIVAPNGGDGTYTFQWEASTDESTWAFIPAATAADYQPTSLIKTTYFRRKVISGVAVSYTGSVQVVVKAPLAVNIPDGSVLTGTVSKIAPPDYSTISSSNLNTLTAYMIYKPGVNLSELSSLTGRRNVSVSTSYTDGLRRPLQVVQENVGSGLQDMVQVTQYDQFGRQTVGHMPYLAATTSTNKGHFRNDVATAQPSYYNTLTNNKEDYFYTQTSVEESPIARFSKSTLPGKTYAGNNVGKRAMVRVNDEGDHVRFWKIGFSIDDYPLSEAEYDGSTLFVEQEIGIDEVKKFVYKDRNGRVVMTSVQGIDAYYQNELRTYYVYDDLGNLRYILPPLATKGWWNKSRWDFGSSIEAKTALKELAYKYFYDERGRLVVEEKAGINGSTYLVYDTRNRLVFSQDESLRVRNKGEWYIYLYDGLDRRVVTALYKNLGATRESLQNLMNQTVGVTTVMVKTPASKDLYVYYDESRPLYVASNSVTLMPGFETPDNRELEISVDASALELTENIVVNNPPSGISEYDPVILYYYDNYDWTGAHAFDRSYTVSAGNNLYAEPIKNSSKNVHGKLTGVKINVPDKNAWLKKTMFYDDKGRLTQTVSTNINGGTDVSTGLYDYTGNILSEFRRISNPLSTTDPSLFIQARFEYDDEGNLKQQYQSISKSGEVNSIKVAEYTYDDLSRIKTKSIGQGLETLNYEYDLLGRVKAINPEYVRNKTGSNYFGLELFYNEGFKNKTLDGNLSGLTWRRRGDGDAAHAYGYSYDELGRLIKADYTQNTSGNWNNSVEDYTLSTANYDEGGNMLRMKEEGMLPGKVKSTVDDLTYHYPTDSYKLLGVTDAAGDKNQGDFKNYSGRSSLLDYTYDNVGNIVQDKNRGINLSYNYLIGNVNKITFSNDPGKYVEYVRTITGDLLQRTVKSNTGTDTYVYLAGAVYKNNVFQYMLFDEGRVRVNATGAFIYDYYLTDHLGSVRAVITEETNQLGYKATHEDNPNPVPPAPERELFSFPVNVDDIPAGNKFYDYNGVNNRKFVRLNYSDPNRRIGTGKVLRVMSGDKIDVGVLSYYMSNSEDNNSPDKIVNDIINQLINVLLGPSSVVPNGKGNLLEGLNGVILNQQDFSTFIQNNQNQNPPSTIPKAYLNYVLFDDNFQIVSGSSKRVNSPAEIVALTGSVDVTKNGFLYVYVSNESATDVFFDDLVIKHTTGHLLEESSYYPFGMRIAGLSSDALNRMQNDYLYTGMEKVSDFDLELYDAFYRTFDPQTGRWLQKDPMGEKYANISGYNSNFNNPANFADPLGDDPGGPGPLWWYYLASGRSITLPEVVIRPGSVELPIRFVTNDYVQLTFRQIAGQMRSKVASNDNLRTRPVRHLKIGSVPIKPPPPLPEPEIPKITAADPCIQCQDEYTANVRLTKKMWTTQEGQSFMIVKSAVDAAAWEYASFKVLAGAKYAMAWTITRAEVSNLWRPVIANYEAQVVARQAFRSSASVAADVEVVGASISNSSRPQYSVAFEMTLANNSYPGVYRGAHFLEANKALEAAMIADTRFATTVSELGITIPRSPTGSIVGKSPVNWVWHHNVESGVMQLVPKTQHTVGSSFWGVMHPGGRGGFSIWGK